MKTIVVILLCVLWLGCDTSVEEARRETQKKNAVLRFQKVDSFVFRYTWPDEYQRADVYEDTKTGVQYLYVWGGMANGGPAITRLWGKQQGYINESREDQGRD